MTVVIPARLASTRFPEKILAGQTGRPLVQHVVDQVRKCSERISDVIVAADDERIVAALRPFGTRCILTDPAHPSGTDRVAEVARQIDAPYVINVQGDEPEISPAVVDSIAWHLEAEVGDSPVTMFTAATEFRPPADPADPNLVKVVVSRSGRAMYFSRSPIPFRRDAESNAPPWRLHVGIYGYRRDTLIRLAGLKPTPCEQAEKLEQLRALEHDVAIGVLSVERATHGIDTPEQYAGFVKRFRQQEPQQQR